MNISKTHLGFLRGAVPQRFWSCQKILSFIWMLRFVTTEVSVAAGKEPTSTLWNLNRRRSRKPNRLLLLALRAFDD